MAIQTEPTRIQIPFADSGTKNVIPDTNSTPSASQAASWTDGFPAQCSLPLSAGGIPPARADFNGIFNTMTQSERFTQEGGVWAWDATVDYAANRLVLGSDGLLYWSVAQSGPNVGGAQDPTADASQTYWGPAPMALPAVLDASNRIANTLWARTAFKSTYIYVDPVDGDDSNDGLSAQTSVKTIAKAQAIQSDRHGSFACIYLAGGTYSEDATISCSRVRLTLLDDATISGKLSVENGSYLLVDGTGELTISASSGQAISAKNESFIFMDIDCVVSYGNDTANSCIDIGYSSGCVFNKSVNISISTSSMRVFSVYASSSMSIKGNFSATGTTAYEAVYIYSHSCLYVENSSLDFSQCNGSVGVYVDEHSSFWAASSTVSLNANNGGSQCIMSTNSSIASLTNCSCTFMCHSGADSFFAATNSSRIYFYIGSGNTVSCSVSSGTNSYCFSCNFGSSITLNGTGTVSISGSFSQQVCSCEASSAIYIRPALTFSGSPTGKRYQVSRTSSIIVNGSGVNRIPGSTAGTADSASFGYYG